MTDSERMAIVERQSDSTTLLRGTGILTVLGQFTWAVNDRTGVVIPTHKLPTARGSLEAAGWTLLEADEAPKVDDKPRRMPLPLPECANCQAPYRRSHYPARHERCTRCGQPLRLVQVDPNEENRVGYDGPPCPLCGRATSPRWRYCPCGAELDAPQLDLAPARAQHVEEFAAAAFPMPEDR